jgi:DNA-binding NtrC family response regulator
MTRVLVVDDDPVIRNVVVAALQGFQGIAISSASSGEAGLELLQSESPSVVILDIYIGHENGIELFRKIKAIDHRIPIIFITGQTSSDVAIQAIGVGAFDYLPKPFTIDKIRNLTISAIKTRQLMDEPVAIPVTGDGPVGETDSEGQHIIGHSPAMIEVYKAIGRVASSNVSVLIRGESGAGKELVARALVHHSDRSDKPFVAVNCAAIPDQLMESEWFGHEKGAFTGADRRRIGRWEQSDGGTLFLDEIGDMSPLIQSKVLRVLQEKQFERVGGNESIASDVRIIAATNLPLADMVQSGSFRQDLLYRLDGFSISIAPLRERPEDIPLLVNYFLRRAKQEMARTDVTGIAPAAMEILEHYSWPGNVRQLQSSIRHALINTTSTVIGIENLPVFIREVRDRELPCVPAKPPSVTSKEEQSASATQDESLVSESLSPSAKPSVNASFDLDAFVQERLLNGTSNLYQEVQQEMERRLIALVLIATDGNQSKTAEVLGISRGKLRDRITAFGIQLDRTVSFDE